MNSLLNYLFESSLCLAILYLVYHFAIRKEVNFNGKRLYLLFSILAAFIFPLLAVPIWAGQQEVSLNPNFVVFYSYGQEQNIGNEGFIINWYYLIPLLYFAGIIGHFFKKFVQWRKFKKALHEGIIGIDERFGTKIFLVKGSIPHFSFLNKIYINRDLLKSESEFEQVLEHEKAHLHQWHSLDNIIIVIAKAVFWFHPMVYLLEKEVKKIHEYLADAFVLKKFKQEEYSVLLARQAIQSISFSGLHYFNKSLTLNRINMMKTMKKPMSVASYMLAFGSLAFCFFIFACENKEEVSPVEESMAQYESANKTQDELMEEFMALVEAIGGIKDLEINKEEGIYKITLVRNNASVLLDGKTQDPDLDKMHEIFSKLEKQKTIKSQLSDADEVFAVVENQPTPKNGMDDFYQKIAQKINYPAQARRMGIEGRVFVQFVVLEDGAITDVEAIRGIGGGCDQEAVRVISESENWNPGQQRGRNVKVRMVMPITFKLGEGNPVSMKIGE